MERALADDYQATMTHAFAALDASNTDTVVQLAQLHARVRGYGHVKLANLAGVKRSERELAARLSIDAVTSPVVQEALHAQGAGTLHAIPVIVAK
jgi:indolepyruvate ferredoxin oxidoreductase